MSLHNQANNGFHVDSIFVLSFRTPLYPISSSICTLVVELLQDTSTVAAKLIVKFIHVLLNLDIQSPSLRRDEPL